MSDGITDAEREGREIAEEWKRREINLFLSNRSIKELVDELSKREGVELIETSEHHSYCLNVYSKQFGYLFSTTSDDKPARILVVK